VDLPADVRLVGATHRDLRGAVNASRFRLDLYYRIAVVTLIVPPLRERPEDIPQLVRYFAEQYGAERDAVDRLLAPESLTVLERHSWPGNVRELRNVVEGTLVMGALPSFRGGRRATSEDAEAAFLGPLLALPYGQARSELLAAFEKRYLEALVSRSGGNVSRAARTAEMDRSHLIDLMKKHGLK
jgi:DNA-binding NtrC family response regulator